MILDILLSVTLITFIVSTIAWFIFYVKSDINRLYVETKDRSELYMFISLFMIMASLAFLCSSFFIK